MRQNKQKGFTIIEVVLVLAIAGLIFMVVFLALPGLQRSQRDTQRKQDVGRFISQLTTYQGNNKGQLPSFTDPGDDCSTGTSQDTSSGATDSTIQTNYCAFITKYLQRAEGGFDDPQRHQPYTLMTVSRDGSDTEVAPQELRDFGYIINGVCGVDGKIITDSSERTASFAVNVKLEAGDAYCQEG